MSKHPTRSKKAGPPEPSAEQLELLAKLKDLAELTGSEVREERLVREVGYAVRSGPCVLEGRQLLLLDSASDIGERIEALLDYLVDRDLDGVYVEPRLRELIGSRAPAGERPARPDAG